MKETVRVFGGTLPQPTTMEVPEGVKSIFMAYYAGLVSLDADKYDTFKTVEYKRRANTNIFYVEPVTATEKDMSK